LHSSSTFKMSVIVHMPPRKSERVNCPHSPGAFFPDSSLWEWVGNPPRRSTIPYLSPLFFTRIDSVGSHNLVIPPPSSLIVFSRGIPVFHSLSFFQHLTLCSILTVVCSCFLLSISMRIRFCCLSSDSCLKPCKQL